MYPWLSPPRDLINRFGCSKKRQHAPQFLNVGAGQQYELLDWLENVTFPTEANFKDLDFATKAYTKIVGRIIDAGVRTGRSSSPFPRTLVAFLRPGTTSAAPQGFL